LISSVIFSIIHWMFMFWVHKKFAEFSLVADTGSFRLNLFFLSNFINNNHFVVFLLLIIIILIIVHNLKIHIIHRLQDILAERFLILCTWIWLFFWFNIYMNSFFVYFWKLRRLILFFVCHLCILLFYFQTLFSIKLLLHFSFLFK
jgi:hypothetical protein